MKNIAAVFFAVILLNSCGTKYPGYETNETGLYYKFFSQDEKSTVKPKVSDYVVVKLVQKIKDSTMFNSAEVYADRGGMAQYFIEGFKFNGCLEEGLVMMSVGDSASFIINSDSIIKYFFENDTASQFPRNAMITFDIKLMKIRSKAQVDAERDSLYNAYMTAQKEMMDSRKTEESKLISDYLKDKKIDVKPSKTGIYFVEKEKGNGKSPKKGDKVSVKYTGMFLDGNIFDSSEGSGKPFEFTIENKEAIKGFDEVIQMMKPGGKATVLIPSTMGYDSTGIQNPYNGEYAIMPYTPLVFELELLEIKK